MRAVDADLSAVLHLLRNLCHFADKLLLQWLKFPMNLVDGLPESENLVVELRVHEVYVRFRAAESVLHRHQHIRRCHSTFSRTLLLGRQTRLLN
jgi:hypothetical protein